MGAGKVQPTAVIAGARENASPVEGALPQTCTKDMDLRSELTVDFSHVSSELVLMIETHAFRSDASSKCVCLLT